MSGQRLVRALPTVLALLCGPGALFAHDIPNARVDRSIQVVVRPRSLLVEYEVGLADLTLAQDLRNLGVSVPSGDRSALYEAFARETGPLNAKGLLADVGGVPIVLSMKGHRVIVEDHPRFVFQYRAELPERGRLRLRDTNYVSAEGMSRLAVRGEGVTVSGYAGPSDVEAIPYRPLWQLSDEEEARTREAAVDFAPRTELPRTVVARPVPRAEVLPRRQSAPLVALMDRLGRTSWWWLGLMALGLGAVHAIQPGHGKTLVTAVAIGERGGTGAAVLLALVATVSHLAAVAVLAVALLFVPAERVTAWNALLTGIAGCVIGCVGFWRLGRRVGGVPVDAHTHGRLEAPGRRGVIGLGLAWGLIPCWDAIAMLLIAAALGRTLLGIWLVAVFSAGMAAVLVSVGAAAGVLRGRFGGPSARWEARLDIAASLALAGLGVYLILGSSA